MQVDGRTEDRFEAVRDAFAQVLAEQAGTGAAVAAWWDGAWVVDLLGGWADAAATRPWRADSLVQPYSVSKPFAAICALVLVDRGQLELDAPVQRWWPRFTARTNLRQLLSHQAGLVALDEPAPTEAEAPVGGVPEAESVVFDWLQPARARPATRATAQAAREAFTRSDTTACRAACPSTVANLHQDRRSGHALARDTPWSVTRDPITRPR